MAANLALGADALVNAMTFSNGRWLALLGVPITGLLWSLATLYAKSAEITALGFQPSEAFLIVSLGGIAQILALWIGFTVVSWAMLRAFSGCVSFLRLSSLISGAAFPLWIGAPTAAYWISSTVQNNKFAGIVTTISLGFFLYALARALAAELNWSFQRAIGAVAVTSVFLASFTFLTV